MSERAGDPVDSPIGDEAERTAKRHKKRIGFVIGLLLLAGAAAYLLADPSTLSEFAHQIRSAPLWAKIVVLIGPLANWLFVGLCLHTLLRRHGLIGRREMLALVGSAWLLNHLPMRPGLVGRIGYHAKVNHIRVRDSIEASVWSMIHAGIANGVAVGLMLIVPRDLALSTHILILLVPLVIFLAVALLASMHSANLGRLAMGLVYRNADLLIWMLRYGAAFVMLGIEIRPIQIALITAVSQVAQIIPFTGGGFGFREWGVGIAGKMTSTSASLTMRTAIMADVINRIAETIIVIPLGLFCTALVARWFAARDDEPENTESPIESNLAEDQSARHPEHEDQSGEPRQEHPSQD